MVKRISCRVVRSVPLRGSGDIWLRANHLEEKYRSFEDTAVAVGVRRAGNLTVYTSRGDTINVSAGDGRTDWSFDCYA